MKCGPLLLLGLLLLQQGRCFEFVIDGEWADERSHLQNHRDRHKREILTGQELEAQEEGDGVTVRSYHVESRITSRFAHTTVRSLAVNSGSEDHILGFDVRIPKQAFITNFTMNVNGMAFVGSVKERAVARHLFNQARAKGKAAGIVGTNSQDLDNFQAEVVVPAGTIVEFEIHYEEMLRRKLSFYEHSLHLHPGRLVPNFQVDVYIYEPKGISLVQHMNNFQGQFSDLVKVTTTEYKAHVVFKPNLQRQRKCDNCTENAIDGVFTVKYDVKRDSTAGELQVSDGHFVHFFATSNLSPLPKNIVFVIDISGSMWGVKMKQTVEAMLAILDDLTEEDNFNIIDFNHNVNCWSDELVPVSSFQISAAKKYIQNIKPNGGTNINEALMRAIQMLVRSSNSGLLDPRSVSMIILVSDGDPTVGEIKLSTIQKNVKRAMREEYSLFSLGIGYDVDYDFLERIAMENRGIAQRIYANHNAAEQLRVFYRQVSSPLLRRITIQFPDGTVSDVTQNRFDKYFAGSELVVAGKVLLPDSNTLNSFTTASASQMDITLETDASITELDMELAKQEHSFTGFARQMWAYITIKQLIADRSLATTAAKKKKITQKIMTIAVEHQFVTPLTALLVESSDGSERLLANSPKAREQGCCPGAGLGGPSPSQSQVQLVYQPPPWVQMTTPLPPSQVAKGPEVWTLPGKVNLVDNDPHFIIHLPTSDMDICFNIDSKPGHILNLVSDRGTGLAVNGQLVGAKQLQKGKLKTFFGAISVFSEPDGVGVIVSPDGIVMSDGRNKHNFTWGETAAITQEGVRISIVKDSRVSVKINENVEVIVLLHRVWKKNPVNVDFLGVYIDNENQYSPVAHGLIGQFSREPEVTVYDIHDGRDPLKKEATMEVKGNRMKVTRGWQKDYRADNKRGSNVFCWFVHNSGKGFIDGRYTDYIVPDLYSFLPTV
ncbi:inter-alpha-trypsin inhibitor heavy chain H2 [Antennarius striatus]|uniref:inter-alpha-trypsin inhibitor heavy chain H2 n=1 Tax=Antennarius striatus TaxID=241820 RepID=UPI0035B0919B